MTIIVSGGQNSSHLTIGSGGSADTLVVLAGGVVMSTIVNDGGLVEVSSGTSGGALDTTVNHGGVVDVYTDGIVESATLNSGAVENVFGVVSGTNVTPGVANYTVVNGGAVLNATAGELVHTLISSGGVANASSGSFISHTTILVGGEINISVGAQATGTLIENGGVETLLSSGHDSGAAILSGGMQNISGGVAYSAVVSGGGVQNIYSGATASSILLDGAAENVFSEGFADATEVSQGGVETISNAGAASASLVSSGGVENVFSGGVATSSVIGNGAVETISGGGIERDALIASGGMQNVAGGGLDYFAELSAGAQISVAASGLVESAIFSQGGMVDVSAGGSAYFVSVTQGAVVSVTGGGFASGTMVESGGKLVVGSGGLTTDTNLASGGVIDLSTLTYGTGGAVSFAGSSNVLSVTEKGITSTVQLADELSGQQFMLANDGSGGTEIIGGGFAIAETSVQVFVSGQEQWITKGAESLGANLGNGGTLNVISGAMGVGTKVFGGGEVVISPGGLASAGFIYSGGLEINNRGFSDHDLVYAGGSQTVLADGVTRAAVLEGGGQFISSGGIARETVIYSGGMQFVSSGGFASGTVLYQGGQEIYQSGAVITDTNMAAGGSLTMAWLSYTSGATAVLDAKTDMLTVSAGGVSAEVQLAGNYGGETFYLTSGSDGGIAVSVDPPCFAAGTMIRTARGEVAVEEIAEGDMVFGLVGKVARTVRWVGQRRIEIARHASPDLVRPVRILRDAFAHCVPVRDLVLSPQHAVLAADEAGTPILVPVRHLINGVSVVREEGENITYYHVELADDSGAAVHDVVMAHGVGVESYLDTGNRTAFENGGAGMMLHAEFGEGRADARRCLALAEDALPLRAVRAVLAGRIAASGFELTRDADLHLLVDGARILPHVEDEALVFAVAMYGDSEDERSLGVAVAQIFVDGVEILLDETRLFAGWHEGESFWRWTLGDAVVPVGREIRVEIYAGHVGVYWKSVDESVKNYA